MVHTPRDYNNFEHNPCKNQDNILTVTCVAVNLQKQTLSRAIMREFINMCETGDLGSKPSPGANYSLIYIYIYIY